MEGDAICCGRLDEPLPAGAGVTRRSEPQVPADSFGTPEGHNVRYDTGGSVIGITLVNLKWLLERDGAIGITIASRVPADGVAEALAAPST